MLTFVNFTIWLSARILRHVSSCNWLILVGNQNETVIVEDGQSRDVVQEDQQVDGLLGEFGSVVLNQGTAVRRFGAKKSITSFSLNGTSAPVFFEVAFLMLGLSHFLL